MIGLPPGNILQYMFLKKRLKKLKKQDLSSFIEVGSGNGNVSKIFLGLGFTGVGYDLNASACENNKIKNKAHIEKDKYKVLNEDFITNDITSKVDIVISCMVIEHLPAEVLDAYFKRCKSILTDNGLVIVFVPSGMKFWGIEDEIAAHVKRYEFEDFTAICDEYNFEKNTITGLTYPLSNILLTLSNSIIKKKESKVLELSEEERTVYTGNREVEFKTTFPKVFNLILNPVVLYPFYILQRIFKMNRDNMVIYSELKMK